MKKIILLLFLLITIPCHARDLPCNRASCIRTDTTNFDGNLSNTDTRVQTALETLDDMSASGDITKVGDCESADCFDGTDGNTITGQPGAALNFVTAGVDEITFTPSSLMMTISSFGSTLLGNLDIDTTSEPGVSISMTSITGTDNQAIDIVGGEALGAEEHWTGIRIKPDDLDPGGVDTRIRGIAINMSDIDTTNTPESLDGLRIFMPVDEHALHIVEGTLRHDYTAGSEGIAHYTLYDAIIDVNGLAATSEIHALDIAVGEGTPAGDVVALGTHTHVAPVHQHVGTFSSPDQEGADSFAGVYDDSETDYIDGIDGIEIFVETVKEYRLLLVLRGEGLSDNIIDTDPQKIGIKPLQPISLSPDAEKTINLINQFLNKAEEIFLNWHAGCFSFMTEPVRWPAPRSAGGGTGNAT